MTSSSDKLCRLFWMFWRPYVDIVSAIILTAEVFYRKKWKQLGPVSSINRENRDKITSVCASHFVADDEFAKVAGYVCRKCVSVRLFAVKTLLLPEIYLWINVTPRKSHGESVFCPADGSKAYFSNVYRSAVQTQEWNLHANFLFFHSRSFQRPKQC